MTLMFVILVEACYLLIAAAVMLADDRCDHELGCLEAQYVLLRGLLWPLIPVVRLLEAPVHLLGPGDPT